MIPWKTPSPDLGLSSYSSTFNAWQSSEHSDFGWASQWMRGQYALGWMAGDLLGSLWLPSATTGRHFGTPVVSFCLTWGVTNMSWELGLQKDCLEVLGRHISTKEGWAVVNKFTHFLILWGAFLMVLQRSPKGMKPQLCIHSHALWSLSSLLVSFFSNFAVYFGKQVPCE